MLLLEHTASFGRRSSNEIGFFFAMNKRARCTIRQVFQMKCLQTKTATMYDPDVEDRMPNSIEHVSEASQNVDTETSDGTVLSVLPPKNTII